MIETSKFVNVSSPYNIHVVGKEAVTILVSLTYIGDYTESIGTKINLHDNF